VEHACYADLRRLYCFDVSVFEGGVRMYHLTAVADDPRGSVRASVCTVTG
jgi:hypothetical protein